MQNWAKFTLKNFALFLNAVQIEVGEILPHNFFFWHIGQVLLSERDNLKGLSSEI